MTYPEVVKYLESFINYEKIPVWPYKESVKLERIRGFLALIGNPQERLRCIHVAGTKGKGSTCAFLTYILRQAGYKTGLYTSPHLSDFRERIRILKPTTDNRQPAADFEGMISKKELLDSAEKLKPLIGRYNRDSKYGPLSFFEVYTALAFAHFKREKVDLAVLETGLGGRLDATNVANPLVCVITSVSYEHTQKLGNTLQEIATEKAGIIKVKSSKFKVQSLIVISAPQEKEAAQLIRKRCKQVSAKLYEVGKDINYEKTNSSFKVKGIFGEYNDLRIKLLGEHQLINAAVAVGVMEALRPYGINIGIDSVRKGLYNTVWPGRCEVISKEPLVVLDGAQNVASAAALKNAIEDNFKYEKIILVLGASKDKDIKGICRELSGLADKIILTKADNPRATEPEEFSRYFGGKEIFITNNVKEARDKAYSLAEKKDLVLVTGSLFVVGQMRELLCKSLI